VVIPYANAVGYYETRGAGWERAAMIKARPAVGDLVLGRRFMSELVPFVWRPAVDFWAQREISKVKRQINEQRGSSEIGVLGHNIKLGRGGIREIEFFAQSLQLVHGGRDPYLRSTRTLDALSTLAEAGHISEQTADELTEAYEFLRQLEHRLQMVNDQQTQTLPGDEDGLQKIAAFMGYADLNDFQETLLGYLRIVEAHYSSVFEDGSVAGHEIELDLSAGSEADGKLSELGFRELDEAFARVQNWHTPAYSAVRDNRSQELIRVLTPRVIEAAAKSNDPDFLIERLDYCLKNLKAGVRCLSTLSANQDLLNILFDWLGASPRLVDELCQWPERLQGLVTRTGFEGTPDARVLSADCAQLVKKAADYEDAHHSIAAWANELRFMNATQVANNTIDCFESGVAFTNVSDAAVTAVFRGGITEHNDDLSEALPPFAVLASGQYGTRELTHGGPIDLLFVCGEDSALAKSSVPAIRRFLYALGLSTRSGKIASVNFGRTPYGTEAPIVTDLPSLLAHCETTDVLATMMALPQARLIFASNGMGQDVEIAIRNYLTKGDAGPVLSARRQDILKSIFASRNDHSWDVRYCQGGIDELETLVALLQIETAADYPEAIKPNCSAAIDLLLNLDRLDEEHGKQLIEAHQLLRQIENFLAVTTVGWFEPESAMSRTKGALTRACGAESFEDVEVMLRSATASVRSTVESILTDTH
jgi:glutamate-ammonia-ligase adenylyltransferase